MSRNFDIVIFGGTGDLSFRKLLPALYRSEKEGTLGANSRIFATSRTDSLNDESFINQVSAKLHEYLQPGEWSKEVWQRFASKIRFCSLNVSEHDERWANLAARLNEDTPEEKPRIFYFALPASVYGKSCKNLHHAGLIHDQTRVILEKPIGYDQQSAEQVNAEVAPYLPEDSIYRIDHYLGKETVQNLLALRFTNTLFEHLWDARTIDHVQITLAETVGLEGRAGFYDDAGALRDMVQNHLLQLICLIAMDPPIDMCPNTIRAEKLKVLKALRPLTGQAVQDNVVCGQYVNGHLEGKDVPGYLDELRQERGEDADSKTETYVAIRSHIDNWRWSGVPFYLRTGKRLRDRFAEIVIEYKAVSHQVFDRKAGNLEPNRLVIRLQPDEHIQLSLMTKTLNATELELQPVTLNLDFADVSANASADPYKRLLLDAADGNPTLFIHRDEIEQAWKWIDPIIDEWSSLRPHPYEAGNWGPAESDAMILKDDRKWFNR